MQKNIFAGFVFSGILATVLSVSNAHAGTVQLLTCAAAEMTALDRFASTYCDLIIPAINGTRKPSAASEISNLELCIYFTSQNDCVIDTSKANCDVAYVGADLRYGLTQGPAGQIGDLARAMGYVCTPPGTPAVPSCFFQRKDHNAKLRAREDSDRSYNSILVRYERATQTREKALLKIIGNITDIDGKITELLLDMGIEGITSLTNKVACDDAAFQTFCNKHRGEFFRKAKEYAKYMGKKRGETSKLSGVDKLYGTKVKRFYNRALLLWKDNSRKINYESAAKNRLDNCLKDLPATAILSCTETPPADPATATPDPGCPGAPENPPAVSKSGDGCYSLFGSIGEIFGATVCNNKLIDFLTGG